ncbi:hypothetical protein TNCV_1764941 [Trichonephila clavipes]|nr:hypothetical protein TNCV_1764941 [Trichonephila clavipes]
MEGDELAGCPRAEITDQNIVQIRHIIKSCLKGVYFTSVEEVQAKMGNLLKGLPKTSFQNCYQQFQHQMQKCMNVEESYFESDTVTEN